MIKPLTMPQTETAVTDDGSQHHVTVPKPYGEEYELERPERYLDWSIVSATRFLLDVVDLPSGPDGRATTMAVSKKTNGQYVTTVPGVFAGGADHGRGLERVAWGIAGAKQLEVRKVA